MTFNRTKQNLRSIIVLCMTEQYINTSTDKIPPGNDLCYDYAIITITLTKLCQYVPKTKNEIRIPVLKFKHYF